MHSLLHELSFEGCLWWRDHYARIRDAHIAAARPRGPARPAVPPPAAPPSAAHLPQPRRDARGALLRPAGFSTLPTQEGDHEAAPVTRQAHGSFFFCCPAVPHSTSSIFFERCSSMFLVVIFTVIKCLIQRYQARVPRWRQSLSIKMAVAPGAVGPWISWSGP